MRRFNSLLKILTDDRLLSLIHSKERLVYIPNDTRSENAIQWKVLILYFSTAGLVTNLAAFADLTSTMALSLPSRLIKYPR